MGKEKRTEFGVARSECACEGCTVNCRFMPGFLIPSDLGRMIPVTADPFAWAVENLQASPGALVARDGRTFRIPTLVPASRSDGSCIHLRDGRCNIHAVSPFGCAFFGCGAAGGPALSGTGLRTIAAAGVGSLYHRLWRHLKSRGRVARSPEEKRAAMREHLNETPLR
jgi:hypothetical protein